MKLHAPRVRSRPSFPKPTESRNVCGQAGLYRFEPQAERFRLALSKVRLRLVVTRAIFRQCSMPQIVGESSPEVSLSNAALSSKRCAGRLRGVPHELDVTVHARFVQTRVEPTHLIATKPHDEKVRPTCGVIGMGRRAGLLPDYVLFVVLGCAWRHGVSG